MLAKKTAKNQLTLPKRIVEKFPGVDYFDVRADRGRILLMPVRPEQLAGIRARLAELGLSVEDVREAVAWARRRAR